MHRVYEGTSCSAGATRALFQDCRWWPRPSSIDVFLPPVALGIARFVVSWGDTPEDVDVYVRFAELDLLTASRWHPSRVPVCRAEPDAP